MGRKSRAKRAAKLRPYVNPWSVRGLEKPGSKVPVALFLSGIVLLIFAMTILKDIIIDWRIPAAIFIGTGLVTLPFTTSWLKEKEDFQEWYWRLFVNICGFGGIATCAFAAINNYIPQKDGVRTIKTEILESGHKPRGKGTCEHPYVTVFINNMERQLELGCGTSVTGYAYVVLTLRRGILGYDVIVNKELSSK